MMKKSEIVVHNQLASVMKSAETGLFVEQHLASPQVQQRLEPQLDSGCSEHALHPLFWQWQHYTHRANQALLAQQLQVATAHYQHALQFAEQLRAQDDLQESHLAAFVISLHNLADIALVTGEPEQARSALKRAFRELWLQMKQQPADVLLPHLQVCRQELAFFCQNFGTDPAAKALLQLPWPQSYFAPSSMMR